MTAPVWLNESEERLWRTWMRVNARLAASLARELQADSGLSMQDFEVLVHLTDEPSGQLRVSDLATLMHWERSRLSHHVKRMEGRGLVLRRDCSEDGRGSFVVVTPAGRSAIEEAAPGHVRSVRHLVFDVIGPEQVETLSTLLDTIERAHERGVDGPRCLSLSAGDGAAPDELDP